MRILLIEDEWNVASFIKKGLEQSAFTVDWAPAGENGLKLAQINAYHVVLLDLMLPDKDGLQVVREMRALGIMAPVLALSARDSLEDRVAGLNSGCDDYLAKPFAFDELLARLRALLRRGAGTRPPKLEYADLVIDPVTRAVTRDGKTIELTNKEYALLEMLLRHPNQVVTRTAFMESVWGYHFDSSSNILEVYMNLLRKKVDQGFDIKLLHTVRGVGYVLRDESTVAARCAAPAMPIAHYTSTLATMNDRLERELDAIEAELGMTDPTIEGKCIRPAEADAE